MLVPQENKSIFADDDSHIIYNRCQKKYDSSRSGEGNTSGFGYNWQDGGTSRHTNTEVERKISEIQSYTDEIVFDDQFMRGLLVEKQSIKIDDISLQNM